MAHPGSYSEERTEEWKWLNQRAFIQREIMEHGLTREEGEKEWALALDKLEKRDFGQAAG